MGKLTQRLREKDKDKEATSTGSSTGGKSTSLRLTCFLHLPTPRHATPRLAIPTNTCTDTCSSCR
ncbi:hypothetical protein E2C01_049642 [Portunus trituberculatus]|uniref:Uncharacterized protein n=1 Tax=Portunus trituberculatus TaxID=210409 RepID=A0A5B7GEW5_PORTR|nr:hypothetical protein [Portunus trituberculatus]